jgi:molybdate transport system substrate-binding protein
MIIRLLFVLLFLAMSTTSPAEDAPKPLLIAAASDLKFALDEILTEFRKQHSEHDPKTTYGSSGTLFAQIENGGPYDLFLSADAKFPQRLIDGGKAEKGSLFVYAIGQVVVWARKGASVDPEKVGEKALIDPSVRKIAIANPDVAPYGAAAVAALKSLGLYERVQSRLVLGENVAQTAQFVQSGAADLGIISHSLAVSPKMKDEGRFWKVPEGAYPKLEQAGVVRIGAVNAEGAKELRAFLGSEAGRRILERYGFVLPGR